jgi:ABC-2 type transport system ATP-binding protein
VQEFSAHKTITIDLDADPARDNADERAGLARYGEIVASEGARVSLRVPKGETAAITSRLLTDLPVLDLSIEDPPIEEVIDLVFSTAAAVPAEPAS